jgi:alpha-L-rhamnosidase
MAGELVRLIEENGYHIGTGFVGTPYILPVLETSGYVDIAYRLLEQEAFPSWLFPVRHGATTIWERWDGWHPEKGFQDVGMNSFNHYAYGAVGEWMVRSVAGLAPGAPGYRTIAFQPRPGGSLRSARASYQLPAGEVSISWQLEADGTLLVELVVPVGHAGVLAIPGKANETLGEGRHSRRFVDFGDPPSA